MTESARQLAAAKKQSLFREVNERVKTTPAPPQRCDTGVGVRVRRRPLRGTVFENDRYTIVEKIDRAANAATKLDPRTTTACDRPSG